MWNKFRTTFNITAPRDSVMGILREVVLIKDDLEIWRDFIITRMAQMKFSMSMDTTNESQTSFLYMDV